MPVARGGALPPGTPNQVAELVAIERTLARHAAGDRIIVLCDCQSAMQLVEAAWGCEELGSLGAVAERRGGLLVEAITRHRLRIAGAGDDKRQGGMCIIWVKANGGGIAPNAYGRRHRQVAPGRGAARRAARVRTETRMHVRGRGGGRRRAQVDGGGGLTAAVAHGGATDGGRD